MRKGGRKPNVYGAYKPVVQPSPAGPDRFLRFGRTPQLLALLAVLGLAAWLFWPVANQKEPKKEQVRDFFRQDEYIDGPLTAVTNMTFKATNSTVTDRRLGPLDDIYEFTEYSEETIDLAAEVSKLDFFPVESVETGDETTGTTSKKTQWRFRGDLGDASPGYENWELTTRNYDEHGRGATSLHKNFAHSFQTETFFLYPWKIPAPGVGWPEEAPEVDPLAPARRSVPVIEPLAPPADPGAPIPAFVPFTAPAPGGAPAYQPGGAPAQQRQAVVPQLAPAQVPNAQPLTSRGQPAPAQQPPPPTTPTGNTYLPGGQVLPPNGPPPTMQGISNELGKLERKMEIALNPTEDISWYDKLNKLIDQIENIKFLVDNLLPPPPYSFGENQYQINPVCDRTTTGDLIDPIVASWPGGEGEWTEVNYKLNAIADLINYHKMLKQPICKTKASGEEVTVTFGEI